MIKIKISKRLKLIIDEIENKNIIDIGTDHAYVPIVCLQKNKIKSAIATDIRKGPLDIAQKNILALGLEKKIKLKLSNGFENINAQEIFDATGIISGMGGFIICDIISVLKKDFFGVKQLVLQPQNNIYYVRKKLHEINFKITEENFFCDQNKFYNIINACRGQDIFYSEIDYAVGKILLSKKSLLLYNYLSNRIKKLYRIKNFNIEAEKFYYLYKEALKCFAQK